MSTTDQPGEGAQDRPDPSDRLGHLPDLITTADIANYLEVNVSTVLRWIHTGKIPAVKLGRSYRIPRIEFEKVLKESFTVTRDTGVADDADTAAPSS